MEGKNSDMVKQTNNKTVAVKSPLSDLPPAKIRDLPKSFLMEQLEIYYAAKPPPGIVECDYSLWQCVETGLQFAWPPLPGNSIFYEWLSGFESYYPGVRWEYGQVRRLVESEKSALGKAFKVLDVGCGKGDFLRSLDAMPGEQKFALDLNEPAVEECRRQGFQSFCGTVETAAAAGFLRPGEFSVVTAFHCLEHVERPVEFVRSLVSAAAPGGRVFISTPYSPMSFEYAWFDVLNHPPHHMTRWNLTAYRRLAELLGLKLRYFVLPSNPLRRAFGVFCLLHYGPNRSVGKARLAKDLLCDFPAFIRHYRRQLERSRTHQGVSANVILVELTVA